MGLSVLVCSLYAAYASRCVNRSASMPPPCVLLFAATHQALLAHLGETACERNVVEHAIGTAIGRTDGPNTPLGVLGAEGRRILASAGWQSSCAGCWAVCVGRCSATAAAARPPLSAQRCPPHRCGGGSHVAWRLPSAACRAAGGGGRCSPGRGGGCGGSRGG